MRKRIFVILDRDGTVIEECNYLTKPDQVRLVPGAAEGLSRMQEMALGLVVVTNQSGIARGYFDSCTLDKIHARMCELLRAEGVALDGIYYCPHRPEDDCPCRKPRPGLIHQAARDLGFDPQDSFVIGDKLCDINLGHTIHATTILVRTGYGAEMENSEHMKPHYVVNSLREAADVIETCLAAADVVPEPWDKSRRGGG